MPEMTEREEKAPEAMSTGEPEEGTVETAVTELEQTPEVPEEVVAEEEPAVVTEPTVSTEEEISTETTPEKTPEELAERREAEERLNASIRPVVFPPKAEKGLKEIIGKAEQLSAESLQNPAADLEGTQPEEILGEPEANQQTEPTKAQTEEQVGI